MSLHPQSSELPQNLQEEQTGEAVLKEVKRFLRKAMNRRTGLSALHPPRVYSVNCSWCSTVKLAMSTSNSIVLYLKNHFEILKARWNNNYLV